MLDNLDRPWKRLRAIRKGAGYRTAAEFADKHEINRPTYNNHENPPRAEGGKGRAFNEATASFYVGIFHPQFPDLTMDWLLYGAGPAPLNLDRDRNGDGDGDEFINSGTHDTNLSPRHPRTDKPRILSMVIDITRAVDQIAAEENLQLDTQAHRELVLALYEILAAETNGNDGATIINLDKYRPLIRMAG